MVSVFFIINFDSKFDTTQSSFFFCLWMKVSGFNVTCLIHRQNFLHPVVCVCACVLFWTFVCGGQGGGERWCCAGFSFIILVHLHPECIFLCTPWCQPSAGLKGNPYGRWWARLSRPAVAKGKGSQMSSVHGPLGAGRIPWSQASAVVGQCGGYVQRHAAIVIPEPLAVRTRGGQPPEACTCESRFCCCCHSLPAPPPPPHTFPWNELLSPPTDPPGRSTKGGGV